VRQIAELNILAALGYVVFERVSEGLFKLSGERPNWLKADDCCRIPLADLFPFLELFLLDAEEFWTDSGGRATLRSDYWTQTFAQEGELHLSATAIALADGGQKKCILLIESAEGKFKQAQGPIHYAHEASLAAGQIAKLNRELERATEAKSEFLARMSHEIRTPLNALLGMAELLVETPLSPEQSEYVRIFQRSGENLLRVVNEVLDFCKIEAGQVEMESVAFELPVIIKEALEVMSVRANTKGLKLTLEIEDGVAAELIGDPGRLRQVLLNLLGNAIKFTEHGEIRVRVSAETPEVGSLHFVVSDTGIGIPAERLPAIFDSFTQAETSTMRRFGGTGLGLAISKKFVELMGGTIWVESTLGIGTQMHFTARFGVVERSSPSIGSAVRNSTPIRPRGAMKILVADDSADNRFVIRGFLKDTGYLIDEAENGIAAVEKFKQASYDVVLTDCEMPMLDGFSATREMRAYERERNARPTPIFVLTAHAFKKIMQESIDAGCTGQLTKPIRKADLLAALRAYEREPAANRATEDSDESWLAPIIPGYLEKCRGDVEKLRNAVERQDYATVRLVGHQIAGTGASFGFERLSELGSELEGLAESGEPARLSAGIEELARYLSGLPA